MVLIGLFHKGDRTGIPIRVYLDTYRTYNALPAKGYGTAVNAIPVG